MRMGASTSDPAPTATGVRMACGTFTFCKNDSREIPMAQKPTKEKANIVASDSRQRGNAIFSILCLRNCPDDDSRARPRCSGLAFKSVHNQFLEVYDQVLAIQEDRK